MSEQPVNPDKGTGPKQITDMESAVDAVVATLDLDEEPQEEPEREPERDNFEEPAPDSDEGEEDENREPEPEEEDENSDGEPESEEPSDDTEDGELELPPTIPELAEALEVDPAEFMGAMKVSVTVDGKQEEVTLREAIDGYQKDQDYRRKTEALSQERSELANQRQQAEAQFQQRAQHVDAMLAALEAELSVGPSQEEMAQLLHENPSEYIRQKEAMDQRRQRLLAFQQDRADQLQKQNQTMMGQLAEHRKSQQEALRQKVPGIDDPVKGNEIQRQVMTVLADYGYTEPEMKNYLAGPYDHRLILLALELNSLKQTKSKGEKLAKKIKLKPRITKPGTTKGKSGKGERTQELRNRLRSRGRNRAKHPGGASIDEAAAFVESLL